MLIMKNLTEKQVEDRLKVGVEKLGGIALKFPPLFYAGFPDRIILIPGGVVVFVELKKPGKSPRALQDKVHARLRRLGFRVDVIENYEQVDTFLICL